MSITYVVWFKGNHNYPSGVTSDHDGEFSTKDKNKADEQRLLMEKIHPEFKGFYEIREIQK